MHRLIIRALILRSHAGNTQTRWLLWVLLSPIWPTPGGCREIVTSVKLNKGINLPDYATELITPGVVVLTMWVAVHNGWAVAELVMTSTGERMVDGSSPTSVKLFFFCTFNHNINITVDPPPPPLLLDCVFCLFFCFSVWLQMHWWCHFAVCRGQWWPLFTFVLISAECGRRCVVQYCVGLLPPCNTFEILQHSDRNRNNS